jgi:hypothetical protein
VLRNRPLRLTRVSVQQQAKVHKQRAAAVLKAEAAMSSGASQGSRDAAARKVSGGGHRGLLGQRAGGLLPAAPAAPWQGTRTRGSGGKGVRGAKAPQRSSAAVRGAAGSGGRRAGGSIVAGLGPGGRQGPGPGQVRVGGKRPAVAARKATAKKVKTSATGASKR